MTTVLDSTAVNELTEQANVLQTAIRRRIDVVNADGALAAGDVVALNHLINLDSDLTAFIGFLKTTV